MKKNKYKSIILGVCLLGSMGIPSCSSFESEPLDWVTEDVVTNPQDSTAQYIKGLFFAIYAQLPDLHNRIQSSYLDAATDDGLPTKDKGGASSLNNYRNGGVSAGNIADLDGDAYAKCYIGIKRANLFMQKLEGFPNSSIGITETIRKNMIAEARAVRAYFYFELIKRWGGVPIVYDNVYDMNSNIDIPRNTFDECVNYILNEISPDVPTSCYNNLYDAFSSADGTNDGMFGRFNKGSILGLISRMKLYLASPLYNTSNDLSKWQRAADAAKRVIGLGIYELHSSFVDMFGLTSAFPSKEIIIVKEAALNTTVETNNSPSGYYNSAVKCYGLTSPSQNLVDAFLTLDGKTIDDPTAKYPYNPQDPYKNRDPRLTNTIFYNGSKWLNREVQTFDGGLDRSKKPGFYFTLTGYYLRKFLSKSETASSFGSIRHHNYIMRYAEILLNYAEAINEVNGDKSEIESALIQIRKRAGIEAGTDQRYGLPTIYTQNEMRKIIRNERRIELAFEEHRFWDIRRWKIADNGDAVMLKTVRGVVITQATDGTLSYQYVDVASSTFDSKMYSYPIPRAELQGNRKLEQNPGWDY
ncbi:MAG: RagB/SusD family nutrient uptake outer membrane protein [Dysgonamonadaceae bacterium]